MKNKKTEPKAKGQVKIKSLKLKKETIQDLSDHDSAAVKGGATSKVANSSKEGPANSVVIAQCWVARAVYGEENPRWMLFREWLLSDAPAWFREHYTRHGERFARWISPHEVIKAAIRVWMDARIEGRALRLSEGVFVTTNGRELPTTP